MTRADLILNLASAAGKGDRQMLGKVLEALIAEEKGKRHYVLANQLQDILKESANGSSNRILPKERIDSLVYEKTTLRSLKDLILKKDVLDVCHEIIEEQHRADLLRSHNIEPRNRILLVGPPGNGKTSLAEAIADALVVPFISVRYEGVVGSYLGETANRLKNLFDYIRTQQCVLFFDEFDSLGKERGDIHETGEIKRVVSSLLLQIDNLPSYVVIIGATNHSELLDRAVWRRFQIRLDLRRPDKSDIESYLRSFQVRFSLTMDLTLKELVDRLDGLNYSEVEDFCLDIYRRYVLALPDADLTKIVTQRSKQLRRMYRHNKNVKNSR